jgi:hypothetical protein
MLLIKMTIPELGTLRPDESIPEWLVSDAIQIPYFDGSPLAFTLDGFEEQDEAALQCSVRAFLALTSADRVAASEYLFQHYKRYAAIMDDEDLGCWPEKAQDIWQHVKPSAITLARRGSRDDHVYVRIEAECAWDPEHGVQIIYRSGHQLSRVSEQDGHLTHSDAFNWPDDKDVIVYTDL